MVAILSHLFAGTHQLGVAGKAVSRRLAPLVRALRNRRAAASLAGLDDRMLADIGLTRSDLRDAYSEPLGTTRPIFWPAAPASGAAIAGAPAWSSPATSRSADGSVTNRPGASTRNHRSAHRSTRAM